MRETLAVFAGGAAGAVARVATAEALDGVAATLVVNLAGTFLLAIVVVRGRAAGRALVGAGFCGALTTFSAFQVELLELDVLTALAYAAASVGGGLTAAAVGARVAKR